MNRITAFFVTFDSHLSVKKMSSILKYMFNTIKLENETIYLFFCKQKFQKAEKSKKKQIKN